MLQHFSCWKGLTWFWRSSRQRVSQWCQINTIQCSSWTHHVLLQHTRTKWSRLYLEVSAKANVTLLVSLSGWIASYRALVVKLYVSKHPPPFSEYTQLSRDTASVPLWFSGWRRCAGVINCTIEWCTHLLGLMHVLRTESTNSWNLTGLAESRQNMFETWKVVYTCWFKLSRWSRIGEVLKTLMDILILTWNHNSQLVRWECLFGKYIGQALSNPTSC